MIWPKWPGGGIDDRANAAREAVWAKHGFIYPNLRCSGCGCAEEECKDQDFWDALPKTVQDESDAALEAVQDPLRKEYKDRYNNFKLGEEDVSGWVSMRLRTEAALKKMRENHLTKANRYLGSQARVRG